MADDVDELMTVLAETASLLEKSKEFFWSKWLRECLNMVRQRNFRGVERLLGGYGGMGSFNDLVINPVNGHEVLEKDVREVNERLSSLRSNLSGLAHKIKLGVEQE